jgi:integral membrane protein (TIGR01906 family)
MNIIRRIALWVIVICFPLLLVASTLGILINNIGTYKYIIEEYKIPLVTGINEPQLEEIYQRWIDYYNYKVDSPQYEYQDNNGKYHDLLSEKELIHLHDVRGLIQLDYIVIAIVVILFSVSAALLIWRDKKRWHFLARALFRGAVLTVGLFVVMIFLSLCCFDQIFVLFHRLSFTNEFWILDPARDYLIMLFPGAFFSDIVIIASVSILAAALLCGGISAALLKWKHAGL